MIKALDFHGRTIEYELIRKRVKNLNLRIRPDGSVHVSAPYFTPQWYIDRFVLSNGEKILAALERRRKKAPLPENSIYLSGQLCPIVTLTGAKDEASFRVGQLVLTLRNVHDTESREKTLKKFIRELAIARIGESIERIYPVFAAMGIKMPEVKYRAMKSRWGSCRYEKGSLSFNTALAHVPEACVDYVVMHEFCHFVHPNHSPDFHALMTRLMPDWKERKKALEKYSTLL
ncbi:MAG: M48 family metallopeptidase [Oscillospiraceae bacterium]|nr:M48 family metallopeptidase [Oscillospiraceae bacterium]